MNPLKKEIQKQLDTLEAQVTSLEVIKPGCAIAYQNNRFFVYKWDGDYNAQCQALTLAAKDIAAELNGIAEFCFSKQATEGEIGQISSFLNDRVVRLYKHNGGKQSLTTFINEVGKCPKNKERDSLISCAKRIIILLEEKLSVPEGRLHSEYMEKIFLRQTEMGFQNLSLSSQNVLLSIYKPSISSSNTTQSSSVESTQVSVPAFQSLSVQDNPVTHELINQGLLEQNVKKEKGFVTLDNYFIPPMETLAANAPPHVIGLAIDNRFGVLTSLVKSLNELYNNWKLAKESYEKKQSEVLAKAADENASVTTPAETETEEEKLSEVTGQIQDGTVPPSPLAPPLAPPPPPATPMRPIKSSPKYISLTPVTANAIQLKQDPVTAAAVELSKARHFLVEALFGHLNSVFQIPFTTEIFETYTSFYKEKAEEKRESPEVAFFRLFKVKFNKLVEIEEDELKIKREKFPTLKKQVDTPSSQTSLSVRNKEITDDMRKALQDMSVYHTRIDNLEKEILGLQANFDKAYQESSIILNNFGMNSNEYRDAETKVKMLLVREELNPKEIKKLSDDFLAAQKFLSTFFPKAWENKIVKNGQFETLQLTAVVKAKIAEIKSENPPEVKADDKKSVAEGLRLNIADKSTDITAILKAGLSKVQRYED